jgi:hypothetical protein
MKSTLSKAETGDLVSFLETLRNDDELGLIIRAHILIENQIEGFLNNSLPPPNEIRNFNYNSKVKVALACGLKQIFKKQLKAVGDLHNSFAHQSNRRLSEVDSENLLASLDQKSARLAQSYAPFNRNSESWQGSEPTQKDRVGLYLTIVWMNIVIERNRVAEKSE